MGIFKKNKNKEDKPEKEKKKFKDTGIGKFLKEKAPNILGGALELVWDITGREVLENIGKKIKGSNELSEVDKEQALKLLEADLEYAKLENEDRQRASDMYVSKSHTKADEIADLIIRWNLPIIFLLVAGEVAVILLVTNTALLAVISSVFGSILTALINERLTVIQFFFGSSLGSKAKQEHIQHSKEKLLP